MNLQYGLENVMVASCVSNDRDLGEFVLENDLDEDIANLPDEMVEMLDQEAVGQRHREREGGVFIGDFVVIRDQRLVILRIDCFLKFVKKVATFG